jgi:hypothetical protein
MSKKIALIPEAPAATSWSEANVVQAIVDDHRLGMRGTGIAERLNAEGQRTPEGHKWTLGKVEAVAAAHPHVVASYAVPREGPLPNIFADIMRGCVPGRGAPHNAVQRRRVWDWTHG